MASRCQLPAKIRLIINLLFGLLTILSSVTAPKITEAHSIHPPVNKTLDEYVVMHLDSTSTVAKTVATSTKKTIVYKSPSEIRKIVSTYFKATPILVDIAECESHFRQYTKSGGVYRGSINTSDIGVMQINEKYHLRTAKRMGIDLYSLDGNLAYAKYLYRTQGTDPWISSSGCWGGQTALNSVKVATN
jgi:hypothetical protein